MTRVLDIARPAPNTWDRRGLPAWTYHSPALFELERTDLFLTHWQIVGHVCDLPSPGDWLGYEMLGERGVVMRGADGTLRAFHNLCRHRGSRLLEGEAGHCRSAMVCPFHGWVYNLDGSLRGAARPESFGAFDRSKFGLKPIEMEVWHGFIFLRFAPGPQGSVAEWLAPYAPDMAAYRSEALLPAETPIWASDLEVNWKSVRDVDNEGYHVAMAHPALQDLYGETYRDLFIEGGLNLSIGEFGTRPARRWSVRHYVGIAPEQGWLPDHLRRAWTYYGLFPNAVIAFTPEMAQFYQEIPVAPGLTRISGRIYRRAGEDRRMRAARYLAYRIDRDTAVEDQKLSIWSNESMKSSGFDGFHLSDLEYGLRSHHDGLRTLLPVMTLETPPPEDQVAATNARMQGTR